MPEHCVAAARSGAGRAHLSVNWRQRAIVAAGAAAGAYAAVSAVMARGLTVSRRLPVLDTPEAVGLEYEDVTFPSQGDNLSLAGWLIRPESKLNDAAIRWIVMVHGHGSHRADPAVGALPLARDLVKGGFGVMLFDLRACGLSPGSRASAGYYERRDLVGALDFLAGRGVPPSRIGVLGFSLGGTIALMVCARQKRAAAVVADSAFAGLSLSIEQGVSGRLGILKAFQPGMRFMAKALYGIDISEVSPMHALAGSNLPVLLIHGELDEMVPMVHFRLLSRALEGGPGEVWLVPAAGHVESYRERPDEYARRVLGFFETALE